VLLDLVVATSNGGEAVELAGELAAHVQLAWQRAGDKACCSYRLESDADRLSPLQRLCDSQGPHTEVVRIMLRRDGIDVNQAFGAGFTPLWFASRRRHEQAVRALVKHRAEVNQASENVLTPLYVASGEGHEQVVRALVDLKAGVNQANENGSTPLHFASGEAHEEVVRALVENGAI
jgi:ankyrin repeat protein